MISFITVGLNEGWRLEKCLIGINKFIEKNSIAKAEIIYVDSDSTDNSIDIAKKYKVDKIFKISGNINAAIARNVAVKAAMGEVLFFIDSDIEVNAFNYKILLDSKNNLKYNYITAFLDDVNYTKDWKFIGQSPRSYKKEIEDKKVSSAGSGIYIISKALWNKFNGMDERLKRTQDRDFSLRMAKKGIFGIRKKEIRGLHHTIPYNDSNRMWKMLLNGSLNYKGMFIRKHLFNKSYWSLLIHEEWTLIALIISVVISFMSPFALFFYPAAVLLKTLRKIKTRNLVSIIYRILQDVLVLVSVFFFYPSLPKYAVKQINP